MPRIVLALLALCLVNGTSSAAPPVFPRCRAPAGAGDHHRPRRHDPRPRLRRVLFPGGLELPEGIEILEDSLSLAAISLEGAVGYRPRSRLAAEAHLLVRLPTGAQVGARAAPTSRSARWPRSPRGCTSGSHTEYESGTTGAYRSYEGLWLGTEVSFGRRWRLVRGPVLPALRKCDRSPRRGAERWRTVQRPPSTIVTLGLAPALRVIVAARARISRPSACGARAAPVEAEHRRQAGDADHVAHARRVGQPRAAVRTAAPYSPSQSARARWAGRPGTAPPFASARSIRRGSLSTNRSTTPR